MYQAYEFEQVEDASFFPFMTTVIDDEKKAARTLVETLCYRGITEGLTYFKSEKVNLLALARRLIEKREAVANDMIKILSLLIQNEPSLHRRIQECGGFKKFDLDSKPNFKVIDLDREPDLQTLEAKIASFTTSGSQYSRLEIKNGTNAIEISSLGKENLNGAAPLEIKSIFFRDDGNFNPLQM